MKRASACWRRRSRQRRRGHNETWKRSTRKPMLCEVSRRGSIMPCIAAKAPNADSSHVAVLACLHLADRLQSLEQDLGALKQRVERKSEEFAGLLDQALEGSES